MTKEKIISFFEYILCLMLILSCRTVFVYDINSNIAKNLINILVVFSTLILILLRTSFKLNIKRIIYLLLWIVYLAIYMFINAKNNYISFAKKFLLVLPMFFIYFSFLKSKEIKKLLKKYSNIVCILAICSLFFYFIGSCFNLISTNVTLSIEWGGNTLINGYSFFHFNTQNTSFFGKNILRNTGIFVEGPMYALQLIFGYVFTLFDSKKIINKLSVVYFVTLLSTLSITGIIIFLIITFYKYLKITTRKISLIFTPIILIILAFIIFVLIENKAKSNSYSIRGDDIRVAMITLKNSPIFGDGYLNNDVAISNMSGFRLYNTGLSSSFVIVLIHGGIYLSVIYLIPIIFVILKSFKYKNYFVFSIGILQILLYFTTTFQYTNLMMMLIAFNLDYILKVEKGNSKNELIDCC